MNKRKRRCRRFLHEFILLLIGGTIYVGMELAFRGHTHWTMFLLGGLLFLVIGGLNEHNPYDLSILAQGVIGSVIITATELIAGFVLNIWLGLGIWDYSDMPFNVMGQICLPFSLLWIAVAILAVVVDDFCRWKLFGAPKPHYHIL